MALRVTRQNIEALQTGSGNLRVTRQFVEVLVNIEHFVVDTVTFSDIVTVGATYNLSVLDAFSFLPETIYVGGERTIEVIDEMTDDAVRWNPETGEPYIYSYGLGDFFRYDKISDPGESDRVYFNEDVSFVHIRTLASDYAIIDAFIINEQADSMTSGETDIVTITDSAYVDVSKPIFETLTFSETITIGWQRAPTEIDTFDIYQAVTYELIKGNTYCTYTPFVGSSSDPSAPTPPSVVVPALTAQSNIQFSYPAETPTTTLTLRGPELGNKERLNFQRINRETRGGTLIIYADPIWPKIQMMVIDFVGLSEAEAQDALTFVNMSLGKRIKIRDWEGREWFGFIKTPDNPIIRNQNCNIALALEIEANLIKANPEAEDDLTITDSATMTQVHVRSETDSVTLDDSANLIKDRYWVSAGADTWNDTGNWSLTSGGAPGASLPDAATDVHFDAAAAGNCTLDINISVKSILFSSYIGELDADAYSVNLGDGTFNSGSLTLGSKIWAFTGHFDSNGTTFDAGTAEVIMTGTNKIMTTAAANVFHDVTINAPTTTGNNNTFKFNGTFQINDTFTALGTTHVLGNTYTLHKVRISTNGHLIARRLSFYQTLVGGGVILLDGSLTLDELWVIRPIAGQFWAPGDYSNVTLFYVYGITDATDLVWQSQHGDYIFNKLYFFGQSTAGGTITMDNSTYGPISITINHVFAMYNAGSTVNCDITVDNSNQTVNWIFKKDVNTYDQELGTFYWLKGNGKISLELETNSNVDFNDWDIEDLEIDCPGYIVTFVNGWTADSFLHKEGTINWDNSIYSFETVNDFRINAEANIIGSSLDGCTITVGGVFFITGSSGDLLDFHAGATWNLVLNGTGSANYVDVDWCNASAAIVGFNSSDGGNNTNWTFP